MNILWKKWKMNLIVTFVSCWRISHQFIQKLDKNSENNENGTDNSNCNEAQNNNTTDDWWGATTMELKTKLIQYMI